MSIPIANSIYQYLKWYDLVHVYRIGQWPKCDRL